MPVAAAPTIDVAAESARIGKLLAQRRYVPAERKARALVARAPQEAAAWELLSVVLWRRDKAAEAIAALESAARLDPRQPVFRFNLGQMRRINREPEAAEAAFRAALELVPEHFEALLSLGVVLEAQARVEEAVACYRRAARARPGDAEACGKLAAALTRLEQWEEAEAWHLRALQLAPEKAELHRNYARLLTDRRRCLDAEARWRRAIALEPGLAVAWFGLGEALHLVGRGPEAAEAFRRALEIAPDFHDARASLLFCRAHDESVSPEALFAEHVEFGRRVEPGGLGKGAAALAGSRPGHGNSRDPERPLRVGVVSANLEAHAMAHFIEPLLESLSAEDLRAALDGGPRVYSSRRAEDETTRRMRARCPRWICTAGWSDAAFNARIAADGIDILLDLCGQTAGHRLQALARKPAPIQCGWIGYLGTSGMECMDYYLADPCFLPRAEFQGQFTERLVHLPVAACFRPAEDAPPAGALPALAAGHVTFGSFSRRLKIGPGTVALWSELLGAVPGSRLLLGGIGAESDPEGLAALFAERGVPRGRLTFVRQGSVKTRAYLALHDRVDMCVDPVPFTGATTTCHAMWQGVPTLTLAGRTAPGRLGAAFLTHAGLGEFVAGSKEEFVALGARWAMDLERLAELRASLRGRVADSPLCRPREHGAALAAAFRRMWRRWCAGLGAEGF